MVPHPPVGLIGRRPVLTKLLAAILAAGLTVPVAAADKALAPAAAARKAPQSEDSRLIALFRGDDQRTDALDPFETLYRGPRADTSAFTGMFTAAQDAAKLALIERALADLRAIDRAKLSPERQLSYDTFLLERQFDQTRLQLQDHALSAVRPITHFGGLHVEFPVTMASTGPLLYRTEDDYRRNLALLHAWPTVIDTMLVRFRQGMASGIVEHDAPVRNMIAQIDVILAKPVEASPFVSPVQRFGRAVPRGRQAALRRDYHATVRDQVYPGYRKLRAFLAAEYLPSARQQPGIAAVPGGAAQYRQMIAQATTLPLDPDEIHRLGLSEVARIQAEMAGVARQLGHQGPLQAFFERLRTDPRFHPRKPADLADGFAAAGRRVDAQLGRYFRRRPQTALTIAPYPAYLERYEAGGSYSEGAADGSRPGVFYFNTYDLPSRYLTGMTTLYLHEGAPGHHFQISLAQENASLPDFQRFGGNSAFVEGWALYAETLGYPMGLYDDPMQHWGTLDDEMLRAMRLVVDTGLHAKGWSRAQAIGYMLDNSGMGRTDAEAEVDRYIAWPAQALSYKIGALTIQRLRRRAEAALGGRFDLRDFHDQVLGSGALPLPVLENKIERWISQQRGR